jgi:hypothetical protein
MAKIIFLFWLLSGKVQPKFDGNGYRDYNDGRKLYIVGTDSVLYKGEVLNYIRTKKLIYNEGLSDKNGRIKPIQAIDTIVMSDNITDRAFPVYKEKKRLYVIDQYFKTKIYLK